MQERFEYALNPEKLGAVSSYLCDHTTAHSEFLLVHSQYKAETGREADRGALFFQIRQAFKPGEITPEEANRIGYETAMRWTKGKYQFFVCTHIDKGHTVKPASRQNVTGRPATPPILLTASLISWCARSLNV